MPNNDLWNNMLICNNQSRICIIFVRIWSLYSKCVKIKRIPSCMRDLAPTLPSTSAHPCKKKSSSLATRGCGTRSLKFVLYYTCFPTLSEAHEFASPCVSASFQLWNKEVQKISKFYKIENVASATEPTPWAAILSESSKAPSFVQTWATEI